MQVVGDVPIEVDLQTGVLELVPVRRDAPGQRVLAEAVVARVLVRRLETPVELPAGTEHRDRDVVVPVVDLRRDAGRHAGIGAQLHGVLVGRALLVAVGQVGGDIDLDSIGREESHGDSSRLHVLVAEVVDDAAARVGGAEHAAEPHAADRGVGVRGVRDPCGIRRIGCRGRLRDAVRARGDAGTAHAERARSVDAFVVENVEVAVLRFRRHRHACINFVFGESESRTTRASSSGRASRCRHR